MSRGSTLLVLSAALAWSLGVAAPAAHSAPAPLPEDGVLLFDGHGWGHARGMGQWGAYGQAKAGRTWQQIVATYYKGTAIATRGTENIRVLVDQSSDIVLTSDAPFTGTSGGKQIATSSSSFPYLRSRISGSSIAVEHAASSTGPWSSVGTGSGSVVFSPSSKQLQLVFDSGSVRYYRGSIDARTASGTMLGINDLPMQQYLYGVIPREMPSSWATEALRAQAVAARTYAAYKKDGARAGGKVYDICATTQCQVYGGSGRKPSTGGTFVNLEAASANSAVDATIGKVITYQGKPILAEYSDSTGGYSAPGSVPYLSPVPDPWDSISTNHLWHASVTVKEVEKVWPSLGRLVSIKVTKRNGYGDWGGRVQEMIFSGTGGNVVTSGQNMRDNFAWPGRSNGFRSAWFVQTTVPWIDETATVVPNGSFEEGVAGWSGVGPFGSGDGYTSMQPRAGGRALYLKAGGKKGVMQTLPITGRIGQRIDVSGWSATSGSSSGGGPVALNFAFANVDGSTSWNLIEFPRGTHDWTFAEKTVTAPKQFKSASIYALFYDQSGTAKFDAIRVIMTPIANPSFESGLTAWPTSGFGAGDGITSDGSRDGSRALHIAGAAGTKSAGQTIPVSGPAGRKLLLRGWTRAVGTDPNAGHISYGINFYNSGTQTSEMFQVPVSPHDWQFFETPVAPATAFTSLRVFVSVDGQKGDVYFDGLRLEENLLSNPSFEGGLTPWTAHGGFGGTDGVWLADPRDAVQSLGFVGRSGRVGVQQHLVSAGAAGSQFVLGGCNRAAGTNANGGNIYLSIGFRNADGSVSWRSVQYPRATHGWVFREQIVTADKPYTSIDVYAIADNQAGNVRWDCLGLRSLW